MPKYSKINYIDPNELIPYEKNAKTHPQGQIEKLARLIENYGFPESKSILVNSGKVIVAGHGRRLAAIACGLTQVPYQIVTDLSGADEIAMRIADNAVAESDWDYGLLKDDLMQLDEQDFDIDLLALNDAHLQECQFDVGDTPDFEPVDPETQGRLDEKAPIVCPKCGHEWVKD